MNLSEVIDPEFGLIVDDFESIGERFGEQGQLVIVGWSGVQKTNNSRFCILKCSICETDPELFGEGYFKMTKYNLNSGRIPCGCSKITKWTGDQFATICKRHAEVSGLKFIGFEGKWKGNKTKLKLRCELHGEWSSTSLNSFLSNGIGCPSCRGGVKKPDEYMIGKFFSTGAFHPETVFTRSDRVNKINLRVYWNVYCPACDEHAISTHTNLSRGSKPCKCSRYWPTQAYINMVYDTDFCAAIKFGISCSSEERAKMQNYKSCYDIVNCAIYEFPTTEQTRKAERDCKVELECGILLKRDMPDGWTETTWSYNIDRVKDIYHRNGGVQIK